MTVEKLDKKLIACAVFSDEEISDAPEQERAPADPFLTDLMDRALAELSKWEFHELLADECIARRYDEADLATDEATLGRLP